MKIFGRRKIFIHKLQVTYNQIFGKLLCLLIFATLRRTESFGVDQDGPIGG